MNDRKRFPKDEGKFHKRENTAKPAPVEEDENRLEGRNAVTEALNAHRRIDKIFVAEGSTDRSLARLVAMAKEQGAVVVYTDRRKLDFMSQSHAHQGIIAMAAAHEYATLDDVLSRAEEKGENPLIILCDELTDPHNLGAILRTAECAGAHGVVIPKRRGVGLTSTVAKASAGAIEYMPVVRVTNMAQTIDELKNRGVWIYGTAADGAEDLYKTDLTGPAAIVIGNEGDGMSRLVSQKCDFKISIPMRGQISSLNASAAAAIMLYEALHQRRDK
ncbi:MAG: 23S rRNA (guanosine(2251)-2'-O)-methyltransferase RlmB [Oscillospiraceae bacterium]|nr:23S rRNA (guanosine(2251)-2'-O)-methyltransferase RlmB [Oscillospiraceae bacterium]